MVYTTSSACTFLIPTLCSRLRRPSTKHLPVVESGPTLNARDAKRRRGPERGKVSKKDWYEEVEGPQPKSTTKAKAKGNPKSKGNRNRKRKQQWRDEDSDFDEVGGDDDDDSDFDDEFGSNKAKKRTKHVPNASVPTCELSIFICAADMFAPNL